ncbi:uncharacterized protein [Rutidosis leptorrhynchoides]|uniref:uncharacterized protein n=1 Tax=Rutidosis leptorrhynchoides TaxID=125765 RepID=UPI003A98D17F
MLWEKKPLPRNKGNWKGKDKESVVVNVYGPHKDGEKKAFWKSLKEIMILKDVEWVIGGDFNEVRSQDERQNCNFVERRAKIFNNIIEENHLIEAPLLGRRFTRIIDDGVKFSKLDRFLVSESFIDTWGDVSIIDLDRNTCDHCPILLGDKNINFGPKPFKVFDTWLENEDVEPIIIEAWNKEVTSKNPDCIFSV